MWYVIQVQTGMEERIKHQCNNIVDKKILERCFIPYYKESKKYHGAWHTEEKILFPGYVFMVSNQVEELYRNLRNVIGMTKIIGTGKEIVSLDEGEVALLEKMGVSESSLDISTGIVENGVVQIKKGPLTGMEGYIRKIDRHKKRAWLEIDMFGRTMQMEVGLEIIEKR